MLSNAIVFVEYSYNRYSLAVLTGVLEEDPRFENLDIHFIRIKKSKTAEGDENIAFYKSIQELSSKYQKIVVGFSFHTPNIISIGATIKGLRKHLRKEKLNNVFVLAGGPHPSGDPIGTLEMGFDLVIVGEGELIFPNFLESYFDENDYFKHKGLSYIDNNGKYHYTGRPTPIDLSEYAAFAPKHRRFSPIEISRGCAWACKFCQTPFLMGGKMRHRSIESIVKYAKIAKQNGLRDLRFITPVSFAYGSPDGKSVNLEMLETMLREVNKIYGKDHVYLGSFPSEVRPENINPETLSLILKYCANDNIIIGAQSGSKNLLDEIHRGHGVEESIRAAKLIIDAGLIANVDFIFGMPGESQEDIDATIELMTILTDMGARVHSHTFMPLVGTPFSNSNPGQVDKSTRKLLESLRGKGLEYGDWKKQEVLAEETSKYISLQDADRAEELKIKRPLRPQ